MGIGRKRDGRTDMRFFFFDLPRCFSFLLIKRYILMDAISSSKHQCFDSVFFFQRLSFTCLGAKIVKSHCLIVKFA